jgi:aromatic ring-opening dioxygenase LigB subunit
MRSEVSPPNQRAGVVIAVLMPHAPVLVPSVGGERLGEAASTVRAMREAARRVVAAQPDSLVAVSPHSPRQAGAFGIRAGRTLRGSLARFGASEASVDLPNDPELAAAIVSETKSRGVATWEIFGEPLDHGAVVPLWFLAEAGWRSPTVLFSLNHPGEGGLRELGESIAAAATRTGRRIAFLASGDMSHCLQPGAPGGFHPRAREFDREFIELVRRGAYRDLPAIDPELQELAGEDVMESTLVAAAATNWEGAGHDVLSYEGPFGVGYGVVVLFARK